VREAPLPPAGLPPLTRSVAACLAAILELDPHEVPAPEAEHPDPWTVWRNWLASRGLGLVPVLEPAGFGWPGPWIVLLRTGHAAVAFGVPPGIAWRPLGGTDTIADAERGFLVAPADPALWAPRAPAGARTAGRVEAIAVAPAAEAPMALIDAVVARAGRGLEGDRYFDGHGTFSDRHGRGHHLTLIEGEVLDALELPAPKARRNLVTRDIDLDALVGERFRIGDVECVGRRLCEPCAHLERLAGPGTLRALIHRGGLRADVLRDGEIRVGSEITRT
jgi:hypothetical protein